MHFFTPRLLVALALSVSCATASAVSLVEGFAATEIFADLLNPVAVRFARNGQVFVALQDGRVLAYDHIYAAERHVVVDLRVQVHSIWDRGLLGLAIHPDYPNVPELFVAYTHDAFADGTGPRWGSTDPEVSADPCPSPPGVLEDGCVVYGRVSRVEVDLASMEGVEEPLLERNWCQQYPSHTLGDLLFDDNGFLYVSAGDGASFRFTDVGQGGSPTAEAGVPINPCDDPPDGVGGPNDGLDAEGGSLRSQDIVTPDDPTSFDGAILRLDVSGPSIAAPPDNPLIQNAVEDDDLIIAMGLRNPYRLALQPETNEVWIADVGANAWEEINRLEEVTGVVENFGWPCYEGGNGEGLIQPEFQQQSLCQRLYGGDFPSTMQLVAPYFAYQHGQPVVDGVLCRTDRSAISALTFYSGDTYPIGYAGALTFGDSRRRCLWLMPAGLDGIPDVSQLEVFLWDAPGFIVDVQTGADGNLYFVDYRGTPTGKVWRIDYRENNDSPQVFLTLPYEDHPIFVGNPFVLRGHASDTEDGDLSPTLRWDSDLDGALGTGAAVAVNLTPGLHTITATVVDSADVAAVAVTQLEVRPFIILSDSFEVVEASVQ